MTGTAPRIMSFNPCIDAILLHVADPDQIVSISHFSHEPGATSLPLELSRNYPANSGTAEEAIALQPDILLLSGDTSPSTRRALVRAGIDVRVLGIPVTIDQGREQIVEIARIVGHEDRGIAMLARIDNDLADARAPDDLERIPSLIRMADGLVPGEGTLADELLDLTGFRNASAQYGLGMWDILPLEAMIARPPSILLASGPATQSRQLVPGLHAAQFDVRLLQCAGPNMAEIARDLAAIRRSGEWM
jgi:iron complex transport system substrate-binding protein